MKITKQTFDNCIAKALNEPGAYESVYYGIQVKNYTTKKCFNILEKRGITQEQIGRLLGVSKSMISKYKHGISEIPAYKWITLVCYTYPDMFVCFNDLLNNLSKIGKDDKTNG